MKQSTKTVVRPWQVGDDNGVWSVLKEGSYSNINSTFIVALQKPLLWTINTILFCVIVSRGWSSMCVILCFLVELSIIYILSVVAAFVYLHSHTLSDIKDIRTTYFSDPDHHFWVAEYDGEIVGTSAVIRKLSHLPGAPSDSDFNYTGDSNKVAWLRRMAVMRKYRGLGIAKQLVRTTLEFCQSSGYDSVFLITTEVHHAARALYSSMGFQLIACRPYRYLLDLVTVKTFEFEKVLK